MKIQILEIDDLSIRFIIENCEEHLATSLRRIILSEIPTLAIHKVNVIENTSVLPDEFICHRLGLIPIISNEADNYYYTWENDENENPHIKTKGYLNLNIENLQQPYEVTSMDLIQADQSKIQPVKFFSQLQNKEVGVPIVKLVPGQSLKLEMDVQKGIGQMHAKWSPVTVVSLRHIPEIELDSNQLDLLSYEQKLRIVKCSPKQVFDIVGDLLVIKDKMNYQWTNEIDLTQKQIQHEIHKGKPNIEFYIEQSIFYLRPFNQNFRVQQIV